jgi:pre-mRNA cleavage complex 2 protein Pcf11
VAVKSTIDGNVELESKTSTIPTTQSKIKINIIKTLNSPKESKEFKAESEEKEHKPNEQGMSEFLKPTSIKPALCDRNLSILPLVEKGEELSALCSIM